MGFEKLAELKRQLAAQAAQEKRAQAPAQGKRPPRSGKPQQQAGKPGGAAAQGRNPRKPEAPQAPRDPLLMAIARLQQNFPLAFPRRPAPRVPLKLGIINDLYAQAGKLRLTEDQIKEAVATWCSGGRYWACLVQDAQRVDLEGQPSGTVTAAEAAHASFLARRQRKQRAAERRAASGVAKAEDAATNPDAPPAPAGNDAAANSEAPANAEASEVQSHPSTDDA
ncbi:ProQ/FinO family protein [Bordetella sp. 2513F-2]